MATADFKSTVPENDLIPPIPPGFRALKARLATKLTKILDEIEPAPKTGHNKDQATTTRAPRTSSP